MEDGQLEAEEGDFTLVLVVKSSSGFFKMLGNCRGWGKSRQEQEPESEEDGEERPLTFGCNKSYKNSSKFTAWTPFDDIHEAASGPSCQKNTECTFGPLRPVSYLFMPEILPSNTVYPTA